MHVHVTNHQASIRLRGDEIVIEDDGDLHPVEIRRLQALLIHANAEISTPALLRLAREGIPVSFLSPSGRRLTRAQAPGHRGLVIRRAQHSIDPARSAEIARQLIAAKLRGCTRLLRNYRRLLGNDAPRWRDLRDIAEKLPQGDALFGAEGAAAARYWPLFQRLLRAPHDFRGRRPRPPADPLNSMLSFGYALWTAMLDEILSSAGFDGAIGFHHADDDTRPTLAIDMIEPFRAIAVDRLALRLWNLRVLDTHDFENTERGCYLTRHGRRVFLREHHAWLARPLRTGLRPPAAPAGFNLLNAAALNVERLKETLLTGAAPVFWPPAPTPETP